MIREEIDKNIEKDRYNSRSQKTLLNGAKLQFAYSDSIPPIFRAPYSYFEDSIYSIVKPTHNILELGSGSGLHTKTLLLTGAIVTATDIAPTSLELLEVGLRTEFGTNLFTVVADMECLPFEDESFDVVTSAGSLSYAELSKVTSEIIRVLKNGGHFICVDSFNHNPIYRVNRYLHYLRGDRSYSTLQRMPDKTTIEFLENHFRIVVVKYFGIFTFCGGILSKLVGNEKAAKILDNMDLRMSFLRKYSFKIVITAAK
jgi:ubiquinone/menaquinone biosynthesis C-methylase UbiE